MANRFPLIIDTSDENKIKELPAGDNLDLSQSGLINVASITTLGQASVGSLLVDGQTLSTAALTGDYTDLNNTPVLFSGDYVDLTNKPFIPQFLGNLTDVSLTQPTDNQVLTWSDADNQWVPSNPENVDLSNYTINQLSDVITTGLVDNKYLKYYAGAWRPANVTWTEIQSRPTNISEFVNDAGYLTAQTEGQLLSVVGSELEISNGNVVDLSQIDINGSVFSKDSTAMVDTMDNKMFANSITIAGPLESEVVQTDSLVFDNYELNQLGIVASASLSLELLTTSAAINFPGAAGYGIDLLGGNDEFSNAGSTVNIGKHFTLTSSNVPSSSKGSEGDVAGAIAVDDEYLYICAGSFLGNNADIWKRVPLGGALTW